jgi:hypothetical protein
MNQVNPFSAASAHFAPIVQVRRESASEYRVIALPAGDVNRLFYSRGQAESEARAISCNRNCGAEYVDAANSIRHAL